MLGRLRIRQFVSRVEEAMIRRRFNMFPGIGPTREKLIWRAGIRDWWHFVEAGDVPGLPAGVNARLQVEVPKWIQAWQQLDAEFFARNLLGPQHWQLYELFGDAIRYLDIETTGLSRNRDMITVVGIHDGRHYCTLVHGQGLNSGSLREALEGCKLLVTYYGTVFDIPFLRTAYRDVPWNIPHFDLCFAARQLGLTGGLKELEVALGIDRPVELQEIDGFEAVRLWREYIRGSQQALARLVRYNEADTRNLAVIAPIVYSRLCEKHSG